MAGFQKIYTSQNQYLEDVARSTGLFDDEYYGIAKETGKDAEYLALIANMKDDVSSSFDRAFYDKLSGEERFNYLATEQYMDKSSDEYKKSQEYFNQRAKQIKNEEIYAGLTGFEKAINSIGGWIGNALLQVGGIAEGLVDVSLMSMNFLAQSTGIPLIAGKARELDEKTKELIAKDTTGYNAAQAAMNDYINAYTFLDKNFVAKTVNDVTAGLVRMAPMFIPGVGQAGYAAYLGAAAGNTAQELISTNPDINYWQVFAYTAASTGLEALTEWASGALFGDDIVSSIMKGEKYAPTGNIVKTLAKNSATEGLEEFVAELFGGVLYNAMVGEKEISITDALYAALIGGLTGFLMTGGNVLSTKKMSLVDGKIVETSTLTAEQLKNAKKLKLSDRWSLQTLTNQIRQNESQTDNVTKLMAKYGVSLNDVKTQHADEYKQAEEQDTKLKEQQAKTVLDLANVLRTVGEEQFQRSTKFLEETLTEAQTLVDNYVNHTAEYNKAASAAFSALYPNETFTPSGKPSNAEQELAKTIRQLVPNARVTFGEYGSKEGLAKASINSAESFIFIKSGLVDEMGFEKVLTDVIKYEIANDVMSQIPVATADNIATLALGEEGVKYKNLTKDQKLAIAQMICFDQKFNQKTFYGDKDLHKMLFVYINKQIKQTSGGTKPVKIKFNTLLKIKNTFLRSIADAIANQEDLENVRKRYNLTEEEFNNKVYAVTRASILNNTIRLTDLNFAEESISRINAMKELLANITQEGDFDWSRVYDKSYYKPEFVNTITQNEADFGLALRLYIAANYNMDLNAIQVTTILDSLKNTMSEQDVRDAAETVLTKEFLDSNPDLATIQTELANKLFYMVQTDVAKANLKADSIIVTDNQIQGTGKLKFFKGELEYGRDLREEQDWLARKGSEKELSRVAKEPNRTEYERRRELKERLRESPNHEVVENDEYLINIQKSNSYTQSQKNIVKSVKKFFGVNCAFYGGEIYNTQTNEFEFSYGFTDGNTIFLKYRDSYDFAQLEHIIQHENFHILAKQNSEKFKDFMKVIKDNLTDQDLKDLKNELSKSLPTLNEQELLEEIGAMFVSGELIGRFLDFVQVKRAVAEFYENTATKLVPDISYSYWSGGKGVIYAEQRNQELGAFHAVDSFAYVLNSIEKNSLTGASVAVGEAPATGYGDYVFVIKPRRIDPSANEFTMVWNGDAYTANHPEITYGLKDKDFEKVTNKLKKFLDTFDLPEIRKQYLIENFMNTWKDYMSPTAFSSQQFEWTPDNILARLLYVVNNKSVDAKSILEESLYYDDHVAGSIRVSALESFLERHKNITKDTKDLETVLTKMVDDGDIDTDELYFIPHNIFYGKDQHKITRLSRAIQEYYEGRHIHIIPELLFEKLPVFGGDVINYFDDLFGKIPVVERMVSDNNTSIEATTDALFEYFWNRKGVDKTFLTDDETKIRLAGLDELQTLEDIKIQAAAKLSNFATHRATHYSLINTVTVVLEILQDQLNISHTKAVKLLQDIVKSSGIYSDIVDTLNKHTNHPINATVLNSLIDVITKVRQVRNIYFEAKIYNTLDINQDVGALMIPNDLDNNAWLRLKNALAKHAPNVELIEYDRMSDEDPVIQAKELFKRNKTLLFDKPIKRTTDSSTKQPSVANQILKQFEDGSKALSEVQYSESNSKEYLQVSYSMIDEMADTFALVNNDNYDEVRKSLKNSKKSYAQQALRIFDLYTIEMVGKFNPDIAQKIENNYQKTASGAGQTMALQAQRVAERKPISDTISTLKNDGFNVTVTDEIVQIYDSKLKDKEAYIKELEQQIKDLEKQLQTAKNDIDKAALNKQLKEVSDKKGVIQSGSNSDILDHILTHIDSPEQMTKLQEDMLGKLLNTAIKAQEEGKKVGYYIYDENGQPKPFPKATEKLTKTLKKLKSFRMWSMLSSPVTWVRNWLGNQGMKSLDAMTNFVEGFMTSRSDFDKSQMKFTESRAGNDLYNYIAEQNETYIMSLVRGEDVKYETSAEKAADIKRRERQIEYESTNAFRKACLKAQDMADWGLSTGPLGDEPVVFRSICKNMGNLVANNVNFLLQGIQAEANLLSKRTTLTEKEQARLDTLNKAIATKDAKDVFNALSKEEISRLFDVCKERSFQQYFKNPNALSKWFSKFGAKHPVYAELISWVMPFPKVAANVLSMAYRYSPLSFFKGLSEMSKYKQMQSKDYKGPSTGFEKAQMIRTFSEATVGTFMLIAGAIFSAMGLIDIDDDDYMGPCIKIGDFKVSLSDLAPSMTTFSTASAVVWAWKNDRVGVTDALNVLYDNTLLGNVENLLTYGSFTDIAKNVSISYISQYIPAVLKLINKGITGGIKKDKSGNYLQRLVKTLGSYVPGLSQLVPNKIDPYTGKKVYQVGSENWFLNLLASLSPLGISWDGRSEIEKQATALEVETSGLSGRFTINGEEYTVKDKEKYSKYRAEHINEYFNNIVSGKQKVTVEDENGKRVTTTYDKLTNEQKKNVINRLYTEATSMAKIKWWTDQGNKYVVTNRDLYNEYRKMFNNIIYKKNWSKSKFVES